jgi:hypothetical protein
MHWKTKNREFTKVGDKYILRDDTVHDDYEKVQCLACGEISKPCLYCTIEGNPWCNDHDPCIGHIEGIVGVCCGHGGLETKYIAFADPLRGAFYGEEAISVIEEAVKVEKERVARLFKRV